jgi:hypothetical protein
MMTINTTNVSPQNLNGYKQNPNASPTSKEQASFSLPAAAVGVGLAGGIPVGTYFKNRYEYQSGEYGYATGTKHEFFTQPDGKLEIRNLDSKGDIVNLFRFDEKGNLHTYIRNNKKESSFHKIWEEFDESGKRTYGVLETDSFQFPIAGQQVTASTNKARSALLEKQINGKNYMLINPHALGVNFEDQKSQILKELGSLIVNENIEHEGVKYIAIQGPVPTAEERLKDLPKDIPTQFKDVEKYLKDLQVKRSLIGLGIGSGLGVLAYLGVTQLTKPKTEKPS